ncbi:uncharacterized protein VP01_378g2 [Puccinia sorghi]|uniref:Uncharacterized protein n=1 Tax=Puccinia sorghi TaxID=27349 RepID=A0A0L6UTN8_9BASI|nr:uncharacterized protein VP01_378g2 [Puccinia sorghi]
MARGGKNPPIEGMLGGDSTREMIHWWPSGKETLPDASPMTQYHWWWNQPEGNWPPLLAGTEDSNLNVGPSESFRTALSVESQPAATVESDISNTKEQKPMPTTRSTSKKPSGNVGQPIADNPALSKFLANPNSYVSYINPQLKSDGSNMSQWMDSVNKSSLVLHFLKSSISLDVQPILKNSESALNALKTLIRISISQLGRNNWSLSTLPCIRMTRCLPYWSTLVQGLLLQTLTAPPQGTSKTHLNNLIFAAADKSDKELGPRDIQVIYNSVQSDLVDGDGIAANLFAINQLGFVVVVLVVVMQEGVLVLLVVGVGREP